MIKAYQSQQKLIDDIDSQRRRDDKCRLWWLGQSGYLIQYNALRVLIDPYLSDSLTIKYFNTDKPHTRISELVCDPHLFREIDIVTSSHNHTDHLDAETLIPILKNNPQAKFIIPEANRDFVANRINSERDFPIGLNDNLSITIKHCKITGLPAKHNEIDRDEYGNCKYMGYIFEVGNYKIYHSGDTLWFDEMIDILNPYKLDLAILPINGNKPERKVSGNLDTKEAVLLAKEIGARCVIPCHYDLFEFNTADVNEFANYAKEYNQPYRILKLGEGMTLE